MGSEIAVKLAQMQQQRSSRHNNNGDGDIRSGRSHEPRGWSYRANRRGSRRNHGMSEWSLKEDVPPSDRQPIVVGGSILDLTAKIRSPKIMVGMINVCAIFIPSF